MGDLLANLLAGIRGFVTARMTIIPSRLKGSSFSDGHLSVQQQIIGRIGNYDMNEPKEQAG